MASAHKETQKCVGEGGGSGGKDSQLVNIDVNKEQHSAGLLAHMP